jgi:hypothetical protein
MPTKVYETLEIELSNGDAVTIKPLSIKNLKKFLKAVEPVQNGSIKTELEAVDIFLEAGLICMQQFAPDKFTSIDDVEEILEMPTLMKVLEVAGGLKLNGDDDPNL